MSGSSPLLIYKDLASMESDNVSERHVTLEIMQEDHRSLLSSIREKMAEVTLSHCVCRVPEKIFMNHEEKYFPKLVSIGPFHHGKETLKATEDRKWQYLNALLTRKPNLDASLESCVNALKSSEERARKCYGEEIHLSSNEFVKMLLVDGCFIIELFFKLSVKGLRRKNDPFFETSEGFFRLRCDMILLENQIPFFVLQQLFNLVPIPKQCNHSLTELAFRFFRKIIPGELHEKLGHQEAVNHLLDLIHQYYLPTYPDDHSKVVEIQNIDHATKLHKKAGIIFKKAYLRESLLDIKFVNGVVEIPALKLHNYSEILFRNLIAMEQCYPNSRKHVASYALLMKSLIQSNEDVKFLCKTRILEKSFGKEEEEFLDLFKKMEVEIDMNEFYYRGICAQINGYRRKKRRAWCGKIKHIYRTTPYAGLILAISVLVLTFTGILFLILSLSLHHM